MELWIRSQENEKLRQGLFKVNEIELGDYDNDMNCLVINNLYCVGIYKTKERALGYSSGNIVQVCNKKRKSAYGYIWRYADE